MCFVETDTGHMRLALPNASTLAPFQERAFTILWGATVVSDVGTWMPGASTGWLMIRLNPDPFVVSLVQVAASLPQFLFALPAGALADIVDLRKLLIVIQTTLMALVQSFYLWYGARG